MQGQGGARRARGAPGGGRGRAGEIAAAPHYGGYRSDRQWGEPCPLPRRWRGGRRRSVALPPPCRPLLTPLFAEGGKSERIWKRAGFYRGAAWPRRPRAGSPRGGRPGPARDGGPRVCARGPAGSLRASPGGGIAGHQGEVGTGGTAERCRERGRSSGGGLRLPPPPPLLVRPLPDHVQLLPPPESREPASAPARAGAPASARGRSREAAADATLPAPE